MPASVPKRPRESSEDEPPRKKAKLQGGPCSQDLSSVSRNAPHDVAMPARVVQDTQHHKPTTGTPTDIANPRDTLPNQACQPDPAHAPEATVQQADTGFFTLPPEMVQMIVSHTGKGERLMLSLACRYLRHCVYKYRQHNRSDAEIALIIDQLERSSGTDSVAPDILAAHSYPSERPVKELLLAAVKRAGMSMVSFLLVNSAAAREIAYKQSAMLIQTLCASYKTSLAGLVRLGVMHTSTLPWEAIKGANFRQTCHRHSDRRCPSSAEESDTSGDDDDVVIDRTVSCCVPWAIQCKSTEWTKCYRLQKAQYGTAAYQSLLAPLHQSAPPVLHDMQARVFACFGYLCAYAPWADTIQAALCDRLEFPAVVWLQSTNYETHLRCRPANRVTMKGPWCDRKLAKSK